MTINCGIFFFCNNYIVSGSQAIRVEIEEKRKKKNNKPSG